MLGVVGLKVWPRVNLIKLLHLYVFQLYTVHVKSHLWIHGFNKGNFDAGINSCSTGQTTSVDYTCKFCTQRTCSDKHVAVAHGHKFFDVFPWLNEFFFKHVIWRTKVASCSASKRQQGCCLGAVFFESDKKSHKHGKPFVRSWTASVQILEWNEMIYLMSETWEVFAQSSEPEAHVKNARQTRNTKQDKMWIMHIQI